MNGRILTIDVTKFHELEAVHTPPPDGHYSIRPRDVERLQEWMAMRDDKPAAQQDWHAFTRELFEAIVGTDLYDDAP